MIIRNAQTDDVPKLAALGAATFAGTFQHLYSAENLASFLGRFHSEDYYHAALADPSIRIIVIEEAGELIGYTKINPNGLPCDPPRPDALELARLYLAEGQRSKGLGHRLMQAVIDHAETHNFPEIILSVYADNIGAHKFYARYGFEKIGEYKFKVGDHLDDEWIIRRPV